MGAGLSVSRLGDNYILTSSHTLHWNVKCTSGPL
jgi:hypothetical protein